MKTSAVPLLHAAIADRPGRHIVAYRGDAILDWNDFRARASRLTQQLARRHEQRWGLACRDAYYFLVALFAALHAGKRAVIPPNFQIGTCTALAPEVDGWIVDDADSILMPNISAACSEPFADAAPTTQPIPDDAAIDLFTSGTTGAPKRVAKRFSQLAAEVEVLEACWGAEFAAAVVVGTVPHHHIYGLLFRLLWPLAAGRAFDVLPCGDPNELVQRLRKLGRAAIVSSPAQLSRLPDLTDPGVLAPQALRIFSSGGPLPPNAASAFERALGEAPTEVYGSSETGGIAWRAQRSAADGATWIPLPRVQVRAGADGALNVRSPFAGDGDWLATADGVEFLADGRFRLVGRLDRIVKVEEKRLSLSEMEERLRRHPWVAEAGVVLLEGRRRAVGAVLALNAAGLERLAQADKLGIVREIKGFLAQYYEAPLLPRRWRLAESLPQNERGKVSSQALAALFAQPEQRDT